MGLKCGSCHITEVCFNGENMLNSMKAGESQVGEWGSENDWIWFVFMRKGKIIPSIWFGKTEMKFAGV